MFKIPIKPSFFTGHTYWEAKKYGVVLVEKQEDIEPVWRLLCDQDDYWESYLNLIKVAPKEISGVGDLVRLCEYCGKTDIDNVEDLQKKIPFIIYQDFDRDED